MSTAKTLMLFALLAAEVTGAEPPVSALAFTPDQQHLLVGSQRGVDVYAWRGAEALGPQAVRSIAIDMPQIHDIAFSPNGQYFAIAGGVASQYGEVVLCQWPSCQIQWRSVVHDDLVYQISWNDRGDVLATAGADQKVACLNADSGKPRHILLGHSRPVLAVAFIPNTPILVSAGIDRSLRVWNASTGAAVRQLDNHTDIVNDLAARPAVPDTLPMLVSVGADRTVRFWQPTIGRFVRFLRLPAEPLSVAWLPDAKHVLVGCTDGHVRVVDHETLETVMDRPMTDGWIYEVATAADDDRVAVGGSEFFLAPLPEMALPGRVDSR